MYQLTTAEPPADRRTNFDRATTTRFLDKARCRDSNPNSVRDVLCAAPEPRPSGQSACAERRHTLPMPVIFQVGKCVGFGSTSEVSLEGMVIDTEDPCLYGERIVVKFRAAGVGQPESAPAVVQWVEPGRGMGVQFESLRPRVRLALQKMLAQP